MCLNELSFSSFFLQPFGEVPVLEDGDLKLFGTIILFLKLTFKSWIWMWRFCKRLHNYYLFI